MPDIQTPHPDTILSSPFLVSTHRPTKRRAEKNGSDFQKQWQGVGLCAFFWTTKGLIFFDEKAMSLRNKCASLFPVCFLRKIEMPARHTAVLKQQCSALARGIKTNMQQKRNLCLDNKPIFFAYIWDKFGCSLAILWNRRHTMTQNSVLFTYRYKNGEISGKIFDVLCSQSY